MSAGIRTRQVRYLPGDQSERTKDERVSVRIFCCCYCVCDEILIGESSFLPERSLITHTITLGYFTWRSPRPGGNSGYSPRNLDRLGVTCWCLSTCFPRGFVGRGLFLRFKKISWLLGFIFDRLVFIFSYSVFY